MPLIAFTLIAACGHKQDDQQNKQQSVTVAPPSPFKIGNDTAQAKPLPKDQSPYEQTDPLPAATGRSTPDAATDRYLSLPTGNATQAPR